MKINELKLITNYIDPNKKINSEYGCVSGEVWLNKEMKRIGKCQIVSDNNGFIALYPLQSNLAVVKKEIKVGSGAQRFSRGY